MAALRITRSLVPDASVLSAASEEASLLRLHLRKAADRGAGTRICETSLRGNVTIDVLVVEVASRLPKPVAIMTSDL